jgi:hypothetical protein
MNYEKYDSISGSSDSLEFEFTSEGPNGEFKKIVQFSQTNNPEIYNLGFGDKLENGEIDDHIRNNNQDRNKILATVATIVYEFTSKYPSKMVFFSGSTEERTRLYRMAISKNLKELETDFKILGVNFDEQKSVMEIFRFSEGFLVKRKIH